VIKRTKLIICNDSFRAGKKRRGKLGASVYYEWTPEEIAAVNAELDTGLLVRRLGALFDHPKEQLKLI